MFLLWKLFGVKAWNAYFPCVLLWTDYTLGVFREKWRAHAAVAAVVGMLKILALNRHAETQRSDDAEGMRSTRQWSDCAHSQVKSLLWHTVIQVLSELPAHWVLLVMYCTLKFETSLEVSWIESHQMTIYWSLLHFYKGIWSLRVFRAPRCLACFSSAVW